MQRREAFVHEHLVDDDLGEERREQAKELEKEGRDEHLAEEFAIFDDGRNEPGEIKLQILKTQVGPLRKEQQFARPSRFELLARKHERASFNRVLNQGLLPVDLGQDDISPVRSLRDGRDRSARQFAPVSLEQAGLEAEVLSSTEKIGISEQLPQLGK